VTIPAFRVGVVGARRVREGTGEHLARFLHAAGTKVVAVLGTSADSAAEAAAGLATRHGIAATPYADPERLLADARLDALVVASPDATHRAYLERALSAGLHVLCEKPLLHGGPDAVEAGERLVDAFAARGLCLAVNAQWRYALPSYLRLHPDVNPRAARRFRMELSPRVLGAEALPGALPHPLSLLDHLFPAPDQPLEDIRWDVEGADAWSVAFRHPGGEAGVATEVVLRACATPPRPAAFGFDGAMARRAIHEPGYRLALTTDDGLREVALPDPVEALVKAFVARVRKGPPFAPDPTIRPGLHRLRALEQALPASMRVATAPGGG